MDKVGDLLRREYDWSASLGEVTARVLLVYADADSVRPDHSVRFFQHLGGGLRDADWDASQRPPHQLAVFPGRTHYDILDAPGLADTVRTFLTAD